MKIPPGQTEQSVVDAIEKVVSVLAPSFVFGPYDLDDIRQQGRLFALQVLDKDRYDPARPLENFLYTHVRNRLLNLRRDKLRRNDPPCKRCHSGNPCEEAEGHVCDKYAAWLARNQAKADLLRPLDLTNISEDKVRRTRVTSSVQEDAELSEFVKRIDEQLPVEFRSTFLQMRAGVSVPKSRRQQVEAAMKEILRGEVECPSEAD